MYTLNQTNNVYSGLITLYKIMYTTIVFKTFCASITFHKQVKYKAFSTITWYSVIWRDLYFYVPSDYMYIFYCNLLR